MKYKHTITIADIQMNIITEEETEVVEAMVGVLDRRIREIFLKSENRCTKIEAALLCALDYCSEKSKLQETVNRLEEEMRGVDINAMLAELDALKAENEKLTSQLTYTEDQARTMKSGIDIANDQIRILKTQVSEAEEKTAALVAELHGAKQAAVSADEFEEKIAELEAALAAKDAEIDTKNAEYEAKVAEYDKLNKAYGEAAEKIEELEDEIDSLEDELEEQNENADEAKVDSAEEVEEVEEEVVVEIVVEEDNAEAVVEEIVAEVIAEEAAEAVAEEIVADAAEPEKRPVAAIADNIEEAFELDMKPLRRGNIDGNQLTIDSQLEDSAEKPEETTSVEKEKQKAHKRVRSMFDLITFDNV